MPSTCMPNFTDNPSHNDLRRLGDQQITQQIFLFYIFFLKVKQIPNISDLILFRIFSYIITVYLLKYIALLLKEINIV